GRLVEKDNLRIDRQHPRERHLLLVSSAQRVDRIIQPIELQFEAASELLGPAQLLVAADEAEAVGHAPDVESRDVAGNRHVEKQAVALAVLGHINQSLANAVAIVAERELPS